MRLSCLAVLVLAPAIAHADDLAVGAAVGAGGQGDASYGALELRLDSEWRGVRIGLGGRAVVEGGAFRTREWDRAIDAIAILRQLEAHAGPFALAAGALAPSTIGHVTHAMRQTLDDRARTGVRASMSTRSMDARSMDARSREDAGASDVAVDLDASAEIDDVLDPALIGGALAWQVAPTWGVRAATAIDPETDRWAFELGAARRWERADRRIELGASVVGERWIALPAMPDSSSSAHPHRGAGAVGFASAAFDRADARWTITGDIRAGNGTNGAAFGPLYRAERARSLAPASDAAPAPMMPVPARTILDEAKVGIGGGLELGVTSERGWASIGGRVRPGIGPIASASVGAPMGRYLQAGGWLAASPRASAGAAELRVAWASHFYTSLQMARMYTLEDTSTGTAPLEPAWSATVWFGASTH